MLETVMWFIRSLSSNNVFDFKLESLEALLFHHCDEDAEPEISTLLCRDEARDIYESLRATSTRTPEISLRETIFSILSLVHRVDAGSADLLRATFSKAAVQYQNRMLQT